MCAEGGAFVGEVFAEDVSDPFLRFDGTFALVSDAVLIEPRGREAPYSGVVVDTASGSACAQQVINFGWPPTSLDCFGPPPLRQTNRRFLFALAPARGQCGCLAPCPVSRCAGGVKVVVDLGPAFREDPHDLVGHAGDFVHMSAWPPLNADGSSQFGTDDRLEHFTCRFRMRIQVWVDDR